MGRFDPKFGLLSTTGYVYVVISTGNLNPQQTVDLSWVQAFQRHGGGGGGGGGGNNNNKAAEFGRVLDDLLGRIDESLGTWAEATRKQNTPSTSSQQQQQQQQQKQQQKQEAQAAAFAAAAGYEENGPMRFLKQYVVGGNGKLGSHFHFSTAAVDLVTSAPCTPDDDAPPPPPPPPPPTPPPSSTASNE